MRDYSVSEAFQEIEEYLINSMIRNMSRHLTQERREGLNYTQWQAEQLAALAEFRDDNRERFPDYFSTINDRLEEALRRAAKTGELSQEETILRAIKAGWRGHRSAARDNLSAAFFRINDRKLNAYIAAVKRDMKKAENALLRMSEDIYRKTIFKAGVAFNTGAYTLPQAVDSATRDFLAQGINCIEYKNGARVNIDTYAEMAIRTSATRCYLMGEARKRDEWGINTVIVNKRGIACPKCLRYVGKVYYDDVYGNTPVPDNKYPLLSAAIAGGLYHPNCKDIHTTWFEGISAPPEDMTEEQKQKAEENYRLEQRQRYNERQIRKYKRLRAGTLDPEQRDKYENRLAQWEQYNKAFVEQHGDVLRQRAEREQVRGLNISVPKPPVSAKIQTTSQKYMSQTKTDWSMAQPQSHSKEEIDDLIQYANGFGLHLKQPYSFDGDIELYKSQIKTIADLRKEFGITDYLQIGVKDFSDEGVFGETTLNNQRVWINRKALWNREVTEMNMREVTTDGIRFLAASKAEGIAAHEFGHILESKLKNPKTNILDICADMIYNIDGEQLYGQDIIEWLKTNFSDYSTYLKVVSQKRICYSEILPEILSVYSTGSNEYADYFVSAVKRRL